MDIVTGLETLKKGCCSGQLHDLRGKAGICEVFLAGFRWRVGNQGIGWIGLIERENLKIPTD